MFDKLEILNMAHGMATHAAARQSVVARNIAHSDTPGYRARDVASFAQTYQQQPADQMRASRVGHLVTDRATALDVHEVPGLEASPNGNTVSLETEMIKGIEAKRQHDRALAIYRSSLGILRSSLGR